MVILCAIHTWCLKRKMPKTPRVVRSSPVKSNLQQTWVARLKTNPVVTAFLSLVALIVGAVAFAEAASKIPAIWNRAFNRPVVMLSTSLYIAEVANQPSPKEKFLLEEIRDLSTGCPVVRMETAPNEKGMWASPGPQGARAKVMLKIFIRNIPARSGRTYALICLRHNCLSNFRKYPQHRISPRK